MKHIPLLGLLIASTFAAGCSFEQSSKLLTPTAPSGNTAGAAGTTNPPATSSSSFSGTWGSSKIPGIPNLSNCSEPKWTITEQSGTSVAGTMTATCTGGTTVSANLTGEMASADKLNLTAKGTVLAVGIPCAFDLAGVGTRQGSDSMKLDYQGTTCLGTVSGTEMLRRFPTTP